MDFESAKLHFKKISGIYKIHNTLNEMSYIGQSINIGKRLWSDHKLVLDNNKHRNKLLQSDYTKYGGDIFSCAVLEVENDHNKLQEKEEFYKSKTKKLYNKIFIQTIPTLSNSDVQRFWNSVSVLSDNECWNWKSCKYNRYGVFTIKDKCYSSHRISYYIYNNKIHKNLCVLHSCDNRRCCNPKHLHLGSHYTNMREKHLKGKGNTVINPEIAIFMREQFKNHISKKDIKLKCLDIFNINVSLDLIGRVISNQTWYDLKMERSNG